MLCKSCFKTYIPVVLLAPAMPRLNHNYTPHFLSRISNNCSICCSQVVFGLQHQFSGYYSRYRAGSLFCLHFCSGIQHCQSCLGAKQVTFDILLTEDNPVNQKLAVKILEKYGHTVEIAENGSLAVDAFKGRMAQNKPFEIILVR